MNLRDFFDFCMVHCPASFRFSQFELVDLLLLLGFEFCLLNLNKKRGSKTAAFFIYLVEQIGIEPTASALRTPRSPN